MCQGLCGEKCGSVRALCMALNGEAAVVRALAVEAMGRLAAFSPADMLTWNDTAAVCTQVLCVRRPNLD